jgi:signal transduction histidine kinase
MGLQHTGWQLPTAELRPALELALAVTRGDMGVLMLHDESLDALLPVLGVGLSNEQWAAIGSHRPGEGPFGRALSTHRRVSVKDAWRDPTGLPDLAHRVGYRGLDILPLFSAEGQAVGTLGVMFRRGRGSRQRGRRLVDRCAQLVVSAVLQSQRCTAANQARDAAEQIGRAKVQFLARMSHELRTPLQSIAGYLDLLRVDPANPLTPAQAHQVERIYASEQILVHVIDDLITFSQLESGHVRYRLGPTSAGDALRVSEAVVMPLAIDRGVRLQVVDVPHDVVASGDADKLKQVLVNLTANAVKFTQRGGLVTLSCRVDGESVYFDVVDTGPGIAADKLTGIFEPYVQLGRPMLDHFGGSGLGLAISRDFATGMNGDLTVKSAVGKGSVFTLRLPRLHHDGAALEAAAGLRSFVQQADIGRGISS